MFQVHCDSKTNEELMVLIHKPIEEIHYLRQKQKRKYPIWIREDYEHLVEKVRELGLNITQLMKEMNCTRYVLHAELARIQT